MASVRWRDDRKSWVACYSLPDGKRKQVSTGLTRTDQKNEALQIALKFEQACGLAKKGALTRQRVLELLDEIAGSAGQKSLVSPMSPREFLAKFRRINDEHLAESTKKRHGEYVAQFLDALGGEADRAMAFIDSAKLAKWRDDRLVAGAAPKTVNNQMQYLKSAFREALVQGVLIEDPFQDVTPAKANRNRVRKEPFTRQQAESLIRATEGEWRVVVMLGFYTGQRDRDCRLLEWSLVDFERRVIDFERRKNRDSFTMPMHPRLLRHLRWWRSRNPRERFVLPGLSGMAQVGKAGFPHVFRMEILPKIGIVQPYNKGPGRTPSRYSFHSFRHSLSSILNAAGVSEVDRMALVGHSDRAVNRGYTHTQIDHLREVLARI